jgi:hypothetical protein
MGSGALSAPSVSLHNFEDWFGLRLDLEVWIVDLLWIQVFELVKFHKAPLVSKSLFSEIFPAFVSDKLLTFSSFFLFPVPPDLLVPLFPSESEFRFRKGAGAGATIMRRREACFVIYT